MKGGLELREIIALAAGFLLIIIMLNKKVDTGTTMFTASIVIGLLGGFGVTGMMKTITGSLVSTTTMALLATVTMICILGHLLHVHRILDKMVDSLEDLLKNTKAIIMLIPSLMGVLFIPGGAVLSAPIVDNLGDRMNMDGVRKASINMVFRHAWFLIFPFSTSMILASQLAEVSPYSIIKFNVPMAVAAISAAYILYIKNSPGGKVAGETSRNNSVKVKIGRAMLYTSPIWTGIALNIALQVPFYLALISGIIIVYLITGEDRKNFLNDIYKGIKFKMLYSVAGIMVLQGFIRQMAAIRQIIDSMINLGMDIRILIMLAAMAIGFLTASNPAVVGMLYPIFLPFAQNYQERTLFASLIFVTGFLFYFISPLHLCQVFTAEYFNIRVKELYKEYKFFWPILLATMLVFFFIIY
jgi:hypothetical protein